MRIKNPFYPIVATALVLIALAAGLWFYFLPPGSLYDFNTGQDQGWKLDGVYCGDQTTQLQALSGPPVWQDHTDAANTPLQDPVGNGKGSVAFPLMGFSGCTGSCSWWRIDFVSPDLEKISAWQDLKGYSAMLVDKASVSPQITKVNAQLLLRVKKADGSITYLCELDAESKPVFCPIKNAWTNCTAGIPTAGYTVLNLVVRTMGTCIKPNSGFLEGGLYLDDVKATKK
jgi:hypothetical protein